MHGIHHFKLDDEVGSREKQFVLERLEVGKQGQAGCHRLPGVSIVQLAVADMQPALLMQEAARNPEDEDYRPGGLGSDLQRSFEALAGQGKINRLEIQRIHVQLGLGDCDQFVQAVGSLWGVNRILERNPVIRSNRIKPANVLVVVITLHNGHVFAHAYPDGFSHQTEWRAVNVDRDDFRRERLGREKKSEHQ